MADQIHVVHVVESFASGVLYALREFCRLAEDPRYRLTVVHSVREETPEDYAALFPETVTLVRWQAGREFGPGDVASLIELARILKTLRPDVIHAHSSKAGALARLLRPVLGVPVVYTPHGFGHLRLDLKPLARKFFFAVEWLLGRLPAPAVGVSLSEFAEVRRVARDARLVPNMIDLAELDQARQMAVGRPFGNPAARPLRVGTCGRICPQKNFALFKQIAERAGADAEFVWIGGGDIAPYGPLPDNLRVTGWLDRDAAMAEMARLDVYVQTSLWEGLPLVMLEAMALAKPVLATPCIGNRDLVRSGFNGHLCESAEDFAAWLRVMRGDARLCAEMGRMSRLMVETNHGTMRNLRYWEAIYRELAGRQPDILYVVNSTFGHWKMPGYRPWLVASRGGVHPRVFARGSAMPYRPLSYPLPLRSLLARGLNLLRIKLFPRLKGREVERAVFDWCCVTRSRMLRETPALVHLWDYLPKTAAYWKRRGVPVALDLQMAHPRSFAALSDRIDPRFRQAGRDEGMDRCLDLADLVICPSRYVHGSILPQHQAKSLVIPFGTDLPATPQAPKADGGGADARRQPLRVLFAGLVNYRKGVQFLMEAWRSLDTADAELVLCGRIATEVSPWIKDAPANVRFEGFQPGLGRYFASADIFVHSSLMEGSSKAVYEAMAHGLPVVVSAHAGSVVTDGAEGFVVPPADAQALAAALQRLLRDPDLRRRMGDEGRRTAAAHSWERYARSTVEAYGGLLGGSNREDSPAETANKVLATAEQGIMQ